MAIDLTALGLAPFPAIRPAVPADAPAIARTHAAAWAETYAGILSPARIARTSPADRLRMWQMVLADGIGAPVVFVAEVASEAGGETGAESAAGALSGFLCLGPQRSAGLREAGFAAEISALYLLRAVQGRGLGRALMSAAAHRLLDERRGAGLALWSLAANQPACGFYAALGGREVAQRSDSDGAQIAFGWPAVEALL